MALISWQDEYLIGIESVDTQHKHLVAIINRFQEAMQKGKGSRILNEILNDLIGYTQEHFADEEKILIEKEYENLELHQAMHRQLLQKIERFQFEFNGQGRRVTKDVEEFLKYWLVSHILAEDKTYARAILSGEGVPAEDAAESTADAVTESEPVTAD